MVAALRALRAKAPRVLLAAAPVAASEALERIRAEADHLLCLGAPASFMSIGGAYGHFPQLQDEDVATAMRQARYERKLRSAGAGSGERKCRCLASVLIILAAAVATPDD